MSRAAAPHGDRASEVLDRLAGHGPIELQTAVVVAHPDDETIGMAAILCRFSNLILIHVTSGSPAGEPGTEARAGDVARQREAEVAAALLAAQARPRQLAYGFTDGAVLDAVPELTNRLARDLAAATLVLTHPFEGGHIDHDACALAVQTACARLGDQAPARFEFTSYHRRRGRIATGAFWPDDGCHEVHLTLGDAARQRRAAAFACHRSQERNLRYFSLTAERFRVAPTYDFSAPAPPGATLYGNDGEARVRRANEIWANRRDQASAH